MDIRKLFLAEKQVPFYNEIPAGKCPNCTATLAGPYCSACGQKDRVRKDFTLGSFFGEAVYQFTHFDSKFYKSFRLLLFKPGSLTAEYLRGRRNSYMKPLQLFIVINILYFLYLSFFHITTFTSTLNIQYNLLPYSNAIVKPLVDEKVGEMADTNLKESKSNGQVPGNTRSETLNAAYKEYAKEFDKSIGGYAKTLVAIMIPLLALLLIVLYIHRKFYFVEHLVFATHFFSFFLILVSLGVTLVILFAQGFVYITGLNLSEGEIEEWITIIPGIAAGIYLYNALRKVYRETKLTTLLKTSVIILLLIPMLNIYRLILFFVTFYTVKIH